MNSAAQTSNLLALYVFLALGSSLRAAGIIVFDPVNNPGQNSLGYEYYGYTTTLGGTFFLDTNHASFGSGLQQWTASSGGSAVRFNSNPFSALTIGTRTLDPLDISLQPGSNGNYAVIRTVVGPGVCPGPMYYEGLFWGQDSLGTTTDVHVLQNGV